MLKRSTDFKLVITLGAAKDIEVAVRYYQEIRTQLAKQFMKDLRYTSQYIKKHPETIQIRYGEIRVAFLKKFPFGVHYILRDQSVIVLSVFHTSRDSEVWQQLD
jgi:toxin ParE1/3/4